MARHGLPCPVEEHVASLLTQAGEPFDRHHESRLDFHLPRLGLFIECKRFYSARIAEQMSRVPYDDVIVIQGVGALDKLLRALGHGT